MAQRSSVTEKFGQQIKTLRKAHNLSQEDLAELCGLDRTYISGIERGIRNVSLRNIEVLAHALEVTLADLFEGIEDKDAQ